ncbi:MAG TPA: hypothetical protein VGK46_01895 [Saprospiraceae bacterium]
MLRTKTYFFFWCFLLSGLIVVLYSGNACGQISPGDLSNPHAHLEGILNCTKCHVLGEKVTNEKCLDCHKEIKSRVDQKKGYHASAEVTGKDCFSCHSDHHGRQFEIIRFDTEKFNHQLTGYKLTGAHAKVDCKACHKDERIESAELRKKEETYLGLKNECVACHKDVHRNTLSTDCKSCHNTDAFAPATLFDHAKTDFPLKGKHKEADCNRCHEVTFENSALYQRFSGVPFNSCVVCHDDVHHGRLGTDCKECHTETSFTVFAGKSTFNHSETDFPLLGKHRILDCAACHKTGAETTADRVFKDYSAKDFNACITCHDDVHESRLGTDCRRCHTEESFQKQRNAENFDHTLTGYVLEGKHKKVDCKSCHTSKMTDPLLHNRCADCHEDFHKGQFINETKNPDCRICHNTEGFSGSVYTIEMHNEGSFPLTGAHLATPCNACHQKNDEWTFRNIGTQCVDCHTDLHEGFLSEKYYPKKSCNQCHIPDAWTEVDFEHQQTGFKLEGKHLQTSCTTCHKSDPVEKSKIPFTGLNTECTSCHDNAHDRQFEIDGVTDCRRCHLFETWKPSQFDHNTARFVLDGKHKQVDCRECHRSETIDGREIIQYKLDDFTCAACHL